MKFKNSLAMLWVLVALWCIAPLTVAQNPRSTVRLDGRALFRVGASADQEPSVRARRIEGRLNALLDNPLALTPSRIEPAGADNASRLITVAGRPVITVTPVDAQDNGTEINALTAQWQQAIDSALSRAGSRRLSVWGRFRAEVQSNIETSFARLLESAITIIPRLLSSLLVLLFFWILATFVRWLMRVIFRRFVADLTIENLIKQIAYYVVWALGLVVATNAMGFDPQTLATGLGLTSIALGFALKDILSNFVSGILILTTRPFQLGDQIVIGNTEGNVERIRLRATQIRTYGGRAVLVPNAEVFTSRITNNTASPIRRASAEIFLGYDSDLKKAVEVMREAAQQAEGVLQEPPVSVRVRELGPDDIILQARFWTDSRRTDFVATASCVRSSIVEAFKAASIGLPNPDNRLVRLVRDTAATNEEQKGLS